MVTPRSDADPEAPSRRSIGDRLATRRTVASAALLLVLIVALPGVAEVVDEDARSLHADTRASAAAPATHALTHRELRVRSSGVRLPRRIQRIVAVASGPTVYLAGGLDASGTSVDDVFSLDERSGRVTRLGRLAQPVHDAAGAMIGGMLYVFAGGTGSGTDIVQAFDPTTGAGTIVGHLPVALSDLASVTVGPVTYLVGGYDGVRPRPEIYATTDGTTFRVVGRLPQGLRYPAVAVLNGQVLIAGGVSSTGPTTAVRIFDPIGKRVRSLGRLLDPVAHAAAFVRGGVVYVVGGRNPADVPVARVEALDLKTGRSRLVWPLPGPVADAGVARIPGGALLIGGEGATTLDQVLRLG